ncbi:hypothetical protein CP8484711_1902A, partial [Chlamydia psittaci 84-8471/1]
MDSPKFGLGYFV